MFWFKVHDVNTRLAQNVLNALKKEPPEGLGVSVFSYCIYPGKDVHQGGRLKACTTHRSTPRGFALLQTDLPGCDTLWNAHYGELIGGGGRAELLFESEANRIVRENEPGFRMPSVVTELDIEDRTPQQPLTYCGFAHGIID